MSNLSKNKKWIGLLLALSSLFLFLPAKNILTSYVYPDRFSMDQAIPFIFFPALRFDIGHYYAHTEYGSGWADNPSNPIAQYVFDYYVSTILAYLLIVVALILFVVMLIRAFKQKSSLFTLPVGLLTLSTLIPCGRSPYWTATPIIYVVIFILCVVGLLLSRYYAPVKARIQASRAERQANRKPTKDERIAELERKVAELESKNKDEQ